MIKESDTQKTIYISKEIEKKIKKEAERKYVSSNWVIRQILTEHYKENKNG